MQEMLPGPAPGSSSASTSNHQQQQQKNQHQRSVSCCHFGEFACHQQRSDNIAVRRKQSEFDQEASGYEGDGTLPYMAHGNANTADIDAENSLKLLPANITNVPLVKGHRRSLSLKQRFEISYGFIASEIEHAREVAEKTVMNASEKVWKVCHFSHLPKWMQDNEYLHCGHRPPLPSYWECFKSIFRLHTETGNIWTHGLGTLIFLGLFVYEFLTISAHKTATDRLMLAIYFCGIILCLIFSTIFHTFSCYASPKVIKIFSKLDYCGISLQIIGSMTPALYYGFYEDITMFKIYMSFGVVLCILSIIVSMWDKFGEPKYRSLRAIVFLTFGLSNVIPGIHWYIVLDSRLWAAFGLFIFQGLLYVIGSLLYANRIPERFFPGKCDYLFQSHQIFHILVVLAALVHLNGINWMADLRIQLSELNRQEAASTIMPIVN